MSEASILLGEKKLITVGPYLITFTPPPVKWWLRFADVVGQSLSSLTANPSLIVMAFKVKKSTDKVLEMIAETTDKPAKWYLDNLTLPQLARFVDLWVGALDLDAAKGFFVEAGKKVQAILPGPSAGQ